MEVINNKTYTNFLIELLDKKTTEEIDNYYEKLKLNLYLTLLSLSNNNYKESIYDSNFSIIDDFLRKTNNLKVKIQLKRKEIEIDKLLEDILKIYKDNVKLIGKYNESKLDINHILKSKDVKSLTNLIDSMTKIKFKYHDFHSKNLLLREEISKNILISDYYIDNRVLYISNKSLDSIVQITLDDFYHLFDYLLSEELYQDIYYNDDSNKFHLNIIKNIINLIESNQITEENLSSVIIPMILTHLISRNKFTYIDTDTSCFNIENIKITDLYSFANTTQEMNNQHTAKWKKVLIPNEYLYEKLINIIKQGMYYSTEDKFVFENICDNKTCDFKVSISNDKIVPFLKDNLTIYLQKGIL